jgi:ankyrin repeat protein
VGLNNRNGQGQTPLHFATIKCYPDVVDALCKTKERLRANLEDDRGKTCLQMPKNTTKLVTPNWKNISTSKASWTNNAKRNLMK